MTIKPLPVSSSVSINMHNMQSTHKSIAGVTQPSKV